MKHLKKALSVLVCFLVIASVCCVSVTAAEEKSFELTMSTTSAVPGDTVVFNLDVKNNPGIMAVTFTVHYDPEVLEYEKYISGILSKDTSATHDGYVSIVFCGTKDRLNDGTLYGFQFKVKDTAKAGFSKVTIKNIRPSQYGDSLKGCFANWNGDKLTPTLTSGGVNVGFTGSNCNHNFGEWNTVVPAGCTTAGVQSHVCSICGHNAQEPLPAVGHQYNEFWTIDRVATASQDGCMSRHCTGLGCDSALFQLFFSVKDAEGNGFANEVGTILESGSWEPIDELIEQEKEQTSQDTPEKDDQTSPVPPIQEPQEEPEEDGKVIEDITEEDLPVAEELIETAKKEDSGLVKLHTYLFGNGQQTGMLSLISNGFGQMLSASWSLLSILAAVLAILIIL